jgi:hypothetical protein
VQRRAAKAGGLTNCMLKLGSRGHLD